MTSRDATAPPAEVPSRDATGRLRPRAPDPRHVSNEAAGILEDAPDGDASDVMDEACKGGALEITTHLFDLARRPPEPLTTSAMVATYQ